MFTVYEYDLRCSGSRGNKGVFMLTATVKESMYLSTGWGPLVISRVIRAPNWVIRTLS